MNRRCLGLDGHPLGQRVQAITSQGSIILYTDADALAGWTGSTTLEGELE